MFSAFIHKPHIAYCLALLSLSLATWAQDPLRIGVADSDGAPIAIIEHNTLKSGLSRDIGLALGQALGRNVRFVVVSRKRVEWALEHGQVDIVCNANPAWFDDAAQLGWTREIYPQRERIATVRNAAPINGIDDLVGKRISTIRGYNYPALEPLWASGRASRSTEYRLNLMLKAVASHVADAAVVSELEYGVWASAHRAAAQQFTLSHFQLTSTPTMCAVSPGSRVRLVQLNQAIERLQQQGAFKTMLRAYQ